MTPRSSQDRVYPLNREVFMRLWIFKCVETRALYLVIASSVGDAVEFMAQEIVPDQNHSLLHDSPGRELKIQHGDLGWLTYRYEYRDLGDVKIAPTSQYGLVYSTD